MRATACTETFQTCDDQRDSGLSEHNHSKPFLVSGGLVLIGLIRIDAELTRQLSGAPAHVILHLPGNMVITQELLSLSFILGGLAILSFAFVTLSDRKARSDFVSTASSGLRNVLLAFTVYQAALENETPLTGVSSQPLDKP